MASQSSDMASTPVAVLPAGGRIINDLIDPAGHRLYLTASERAAFLAAAAKADREVRTFCEVLHTTGCRISEALALTVRRVDLDARVLVFETLKKRRPGVFRTVPVPAPLLDTLDLVHGLREARKKPGDRLLWEWSRTTAWRDVKGVMRAASIEGPQATPKGLHHGYGVGDRRGCAAQHAVEMDGPRRDRDDGDLRQRPGRGAALYRRAHVALTPDPEQTIFRVRKISMPLHFSCARMTF